MTRAVYEAQLGNSPVTNGSIPPGAGEERSQPRLYGGFAELFINNGDPEPGNREVEDCHAGRKSGRGLIAGPIGTRKTRNVAHLHDPSIQADVCFHQSHRSGTRSHTPRIWVWGSSRAPLHATKPAAGLGSAGASISTSYRATQASQSQPGAAQIHILISKKHSRRDRGPWSIEFCFFSSLQTLGEAQIALEKTPNH